MLTELLTPVATSEEQDKLMKFRLILEVNWWLGLLVTTGVIVLWSFRTIPFWEWSADRRFFIYFVVPLFSLFVYLTHHRIPKKWQLIPLLSYFETFVLVFLTYIFVHFSFDGFLGVSYFFLFFPVMILAIGLEAQLVIPAGVFMVGLALLEIMHSYFTNTGTLAEEVASYPIGTSARLVYIMVFAYFARYLAKEAWQHRQARERLEQLEEERRTFVELTTHNLRTPLVVLEGYLSMLKGKAADFEEETQEYLKRAIESAAQMAVLLRRFMHILKLEQSGWISERKKMDLRSVVEEVMKKHREAALEKELEVILNLPSEEIPVSVSPEFIRSAIEILIDNAIKFNHPHGFIKISLEKTGTKAIGRVEDNGIGIPEDEIGHIFQKFYRATSVLTYDYPGIGLGLYLAKLIFQKHGGDIKVTSQVKVGSIFTFELPIE